MATYPYRAGFLIVSIITLAAILSGGARAQAKLDPDTIEVSGVRLGMTADAAITALKTFDPGYALTKRYLTGRGLPFGLEGQSMDDIYPLDRSTAYLDDLVAVKGKPHIVCPTTAWCGKRFDEDEEVVKVWLSRTPGEEKVIAVQRSITFHKEPHPAMVSLKSSASAKYALARATFEHKDEWSDMTGWLFDARKQLLTNASANSRHPEQGGRLPKSVRAGDGIGFNLVLYASDQNPQIADQLLITLYDATALYNSVAQSDSAYDAQKRATNARQLGESLTAAGTPKF